MLDEPEILADDPGRELPSPVLRSAARVRRITELVRVNAPLAVPLVIGLLAREHGEVENLDALLRQALDDESRMIAMIPETPELPL